MHNLRVVTFSFILWSTTLMVIGCSGGSSSPSGSAEPINNGLLDGTYNNGSSLYPVSAALMSDGAVGFDIGNGVVFYGQLDSDNTITGSENISPSSIVIMSAHMNGSGQLTAEVTQGAMALSAGDAFTLSYNDLYERTSSLSNLAGTWSGNNTIMTGGSGSPQNWSITFQSDGTFDGTAGSINVSGTATVVDATKNEYAISMTLSHDTVNYSLLGDYQGFAFLTDTSAMNDTLAIFIQRSGTDSYLGALTLQ